MTIVGHLSKFSGTIVKNWSSPLDLRSAKGILYNCSIRGRNGNSETNNCIILSFGVSIDEALSTS